MSLTLPVSLVPMRVCNVCGYQRPECGMSSRRHVLSAAGDLVCFFCVDAGKRVSAEAAETDDAVAVAASEGLQLVRSLRSESGFKGVFKHHHKFLATCMVNGKRRSLGSFFTSEEAALCYARYLGPERSGAEAAEAGAADASRDIMTLTADVARAHAEAEGLTLVPSPTKSGFKGVKTHVRGNSFSASISVGTRKSRFLGWFSTPEAAALCCARAAEMQKPLTAPALTAPEVVATAAEEGLCLVRSSNATGFKNVFKHRNSFKAKDGTLDLGSFRTAEEAALSYSRHIGSARAAAEAAFHTADEVARVLPSELTGAPCIGRMAIPIVVPVVTGMDSAGHDIVVVVATELEDGSSSVDIDVVMNTEVLSTRPTLAQAGAYGHVLATSAAASQAHGVRCSHATPPLHQ